MPVGAALDEGTTAVLVAGGAAAVLAGTLDAQSLSRRTTAAPAAPAIRRLVGSGCRPSSHSLAVSTTALAAMPQAAAVHAERRSDQASTPSGRYIKKTLARLSKACASVV